MTRPLEERKSVRQAEVERNMLKACLRNYPFLFLAGAICRLLGTEC